MILVIYSYFKRQYTEVQGLSRKEEKINWMYENRDIIRKSIGKKRQIKNMADFFLAKQIEYS